MKHPPLKASLIAFAFAISTVFLPPSATAQAGAEREVLSNDSVVQMVVAKVPKDLILTKIQSTSTAFDITANSLVALYQRKVSTDLIKAMMLASASNPASKEVLENSAVIFMVTNNLPRDLIVAKIQSAKPSFDLTTNGLVSLNQNKVPQAVVKAMLASASASAAPSTAAPQAAAPAASPAPVAVSPPQSAAPPAAPPAAAAPAAKGSTAAGTQAKKPAAAEKKK
jgi:hypothetical protein